MWASNFHNTRNWKSFYGYFSYIQTLFREGKRKKNLVELLVTPPAVSSSWSPSRSPSPSSGSTPGSPSPWTSSPPAPTSPPPGVLHLVVFESNRRSTRPSVLNLWNRAVRLSILTFVIAFVHEIRGYTENFVRRVFRDQITGFYAEIDCLLDVSFHFSYSYREIGFYNIFNKYNICSKYRIFKNMYNFEKCFACIWYSKIIFKIIVLHWIMNRKNNALKKLINGLYTRLVVLIKWCWINDIGLSKENVTWNMEVINFG